MDNPKILTNQELKSELDTATKDLNHFDELTNTIEEQADLANLEKQMNEPTT